MKRLRLYLTILLLLLLPLSLTGCLQPPKDKLDVKVASMQESNTITVDDVVELLELNGFTVEQQDVSDQWANRWSKLLVYKIDDKHLLLLRDVALEDKSLEERNEMVCKLGLDAGRIDIGDYTSVFPQVLQDYPAENGSYYETDNYNTKNMIVCSIPCYESTEYGSDGYNTAMNYREELDRIFFQDINNMLSMEIPSAGFFGDGFNGDEYTLDCSMEYYQVPYEFEGETTYDYHHYISCSVKTTDEVMEQYNADEVTLNLYPAENGCPDWENVRSVHATGQGESKHMSYAYTELNTLLDKEFDAEHVHYYLDIIIGDAKETRSIIIHTNHYGIGIGTMGKE